MRTFIRSTLPLSTAVFAGLLLLTTGASAQPARRGPRGPGAPGAGAPQTPGAAAPGARGPGVAGASAQGATPDAPVVAPTERIPTELTEISPNGLTADQVGQRAAFTSYNAKASEELLKSAAAKVDAAWASFLPRLTGTARYTRLSDIGTPSVGAGNLVGTTAPDGTINPTPTQAVSFSFPVLLNNYLLQASLTVPISDYFLKINENYTSATQAEKAARFDVASARAKSDADGRVTFYNWLRNRNAVVVAVLALQDQRNHLTDATNQFNVGNASKADVLRAETNVASAELQVVQARNLADLTERQVKVAIHAKEDEKLLPGEGLDNPPPPMTGSLRPLIDEAFANRFEIKSIDANAEAARKAAKASKSAVYPSVSAFGNAYYSNPNSRYLGTGSEWHGTWDAGIQATWTPTDIPLGNANARDNEARAANLEAQRQVERDSIEIEVMQAWNAAKEADVALESTKRQLASATEAYRVARELFNAGRGISTTLTDAETELTRARLAELNARADARIARVNLDHATGRDTKDVHIQ